MGVKEPGIRRVSTKEAMLKSKLWPCALVILGHGATAQSLPGAGSQLQLIPRSPDAVRSAPQVTVQPPASPGLAAIDGARIPVRQLRISGSRVFTEEALLAVTGFTPGREVSLSDLRAMAARVGDLYHRNGYFVTQAYLPPQEIKDGVVTMAVIEGQYGQVVLRNQTRLSDGFVGSLVDDLRPGDVIATGPLETDLLLLSDLPGVKVQATLVPGASLGASDLIVEMTPGSPITGSVDADNAGNRYTGVYRVGATINLNNPLGLGDVASVRLLTSGEGLDYIRAAYQWQWGKLRTGLAYSRLDYSLGREFEGLGAHGTADVASLFASVPVVRTRQRNLSLQLAFDDKKLRDRVDTTGTASDKHIQVWMASVYGDSRDAWGGGGANSYALTWSGGRVDLQTPADRATDAITAGTQGHYSKLAFSVSRLQALAPAWSLYGAMNGQWASRNLNSSEKLGMAGMYGVRAYPEGESHADEGYVLSLELRKQLSAEWQVLGFLDTGHLTLNKKPWAGGDNHRRLSSAGLGVIWAVPGNFVVKAYYAHKLGNAVALSAPDASGRFWVQAVKYF